MNKLIVATIVGMAICYVSGLGTGYCIGRLHEFKRKNRKALKEAEKQNEAEDSSSE